MKTVFISREAKPNGPLQQFCVAQGWTLIDSSLLSFNSVTPDKRPKHTEVIFFTSPRSVRFYLEQFKVENQLLAAIGEATAQEIKKHNLTADFIGQTASNPRLVAKDFKKWLGNRTVLFPQSQRSNRTMQKELSAHQYIDFVIYETELKSSAFEYVPDYLVFTSPSNAEAFLLQNSIPRTRKVISYGTTTSEYLNKFDIANQCLSSPTEEEVVRTIQQS